MGHISHNTRLGPNKHNKQRTNNMGSILTRLSSTSRHDQHIIDRLVRKPGAFENYCYKEDLFPTSLFRIAYDILREISSIRQASKTYLKILELAAKEDESLVNEALRLLINLEEEIDFDHVKQFVESRQKAPAPTDVTVEPVDINGYDMLLETPECVCL